MANLMSRLARGAAAAVGVLALGAATLIGAGAASATTSNVDFDKVGSIAVHKYEQPENFNPAGDGRELTADQLDKLGATNPLKDVGFTVTPVTLDLETASNWDKLDLLKFENDTVTMDGQTLELGAPKPEQKTDASGTTVFEGLPVGVYLVQETSKGGHNITRSVEPYFVVIPTSIDGHWTYDVHTYPKNSLSEVTKTPRPVDTPIQVEGATVIDQQVIWDITATAPQLTANDKFTKWELTDTLDARLAYVAVQNVKYGDTELVLDTDYTVDVEGQTVTLTLTQARLDAIKAAGGQGTLSYELVTDATGVQDGIIPNKVTSITNVNGDETKIDSNESKTYVGEIDILKRDKENKLALKGAEFQIFATMQDAQNRTNPITVGGKTVFVTGADGTVKIAPLNVTSETDARTYYLVETKAPVGYVLPEGDLAISTVEVKAGTSTPVLVDITADKVEGVEVIVNNEKQDRPDLPLTGGLGTWMFIGGGAALVLLAVGVAARKRDKQLA